MVISKKDEIAFGDRRVGNSLKLIANAVAEGNLISSIIFLPDNA